MLPILFTIGPVKIYTFGIFLILAFFWGSFLLWKLIRLTSIKEEDVFDGLFWAMAGGLLSGRLFYVLLNWKTFGFNLLKFILINGYPGFSLYGIFFGSIVSLYLFSHFKKIKFAELADYFISPVFLALGFGKLGSFFGGAEIGSITKFLLKIKYVGHPGLRHITSFYEAIFFLAGSYLSYKLLFQIRKEKLGRGFNLYFFIWYFAATYFVFDKIKGYHLYFLSYSFNKMVSTILLLTFSFYFLYYFRSSIITYGKKTFQNIYQGAKEKIRRGQDKNPPANQ